MNKLLKTLNIEDILFFDFRIQKRSDTLNTDELTYLFKQKHRDCEDIEKLYETQGLTYIGFNEISSVAVAFIKNGVCNYKLLSGSEQDIIKQFYEITAKFRVVAGVNSIGYKLPLLQMNGARYFDVTELIPEPFNVAGKKPWDIKFVLDITEQFKGTYFISPTLHDMCYHFGIPFDMNANIINDIISTVKLYARMSVNAEPTEFVSKNEVTDNISLLEKVYLFGLNKKIDKELKEYVAKAKEKGLVEEAKELLYNAYIHTDFVNKDNDTKKVLESKRNEVNNLFK